MKVLITGSTGFVGKHLVKKLKTEEHEIVEINSSNFTSILDGLNLTLYSYSFENKVREDFQSFHIILLKK